MRKKRLEKRLETVVEFYHPLSSLTAPPCLREVATSLNGQAMPLQEALDKAKKQLSQVPVGEGEYAEGGYYVEIKNRFLFRRWTKGGWIVVIIKAKKDGSRRRGWKVVKFRRPK